MQFPIKFTSYIISKPYKWYKMYKLYGIFKKNKTHTWKGGIKGLGRT